MEYLKTAVELLSPILLAGLLVYWVYTLETRVKAIKKEIADNNVAIANAFNSLAARLPPPAMGSNNAPAPEAT